MLHLDLDQTVQRTACPAHDELGTDRVTGDPLLLGFIQKRCHLFTGFDRRFDDRRITDDAAFREIVDGAHAGGIALSADQQLFAER